MAEGLFLLDRKTAVCYFLCHSLTRQQPQLWDRESSMFQVNFCSLNCKLLQNDTEKKCWREWSSFLNHTNFSQIQERVARIFSSNFNYHEWVYGRIAVVLRPTKTLCHFSNCGLFHAKFKLPYMSEKPWFKSNGLFLGSHYKQGSSSS